MKRLFAALAIGLTLGFALLSVGFEPIAGRTTPPTPAPPRSSPTSQISTPQHGGPAEHFAETALTPASRSRAACLRSEPNARRQQTPTS